MTAETFGDPEAMRVFARELAARAELLSAIPSGFNAALDAATFEGWAATRLRDSAVQTHAGVAEAARELRDTAADLLRDATIVEQRNAAAATAEAARDEAEARTRAKADKERA